ncbi:ABC transporter permease [Vibrio palustris]|uniref:Iron export permease protein FetB n=1 Tax=Vibrio palustris TaxID=1918946 RepID=A0A1R4B2W7_9VIBR|nr:ABC transporter permease [Vibrio palustris]SJL83257.1 hypothetical protein VPAL9027_01220 [Vibrio palustris]
MQPIIALSWGDIAFFSLILIVPYGINYVYQLQLGKDSAIALVRMTIQLLLVGSYLTFFFQLNNFWVNSAWLLVMVLVGASSVLSKAKLRQKKLLLSVTASLLISMCPVLAILCIGLIHPSPWYNAQYLIPLAGMLLGNTISSNIIGLQNLSACFQQRYDEYEAAIALGARPSDASRIFVQESLRKGSAPLLASIATIGLVTLPGMMTGQILSGTSPLVAIKYQLIIMIAIFVTMSSSLVLTLQFSLRSCQNSSGKVTLN